MHVPLIRGKLAECAGGFGHLAPRKTWREVTGESGMCVASGGGGRVEGLLWGSMA